MNELEQLAYIELVNTWLNKPKINNIYTVDDVIDMIYKTIFPIANSDVEPSKFYVEYIVKEMNKYYENYHYDFHTWNNIIFPLLQNSLLYTAFNERA